MPVVGGCLSSHGVVVRSAMKRAGGVGLNYVAEEDCSRPTVKPTVRGRGAGAGTRHGDGTERGYRVLGAGLGRVHPGRTRLLGVAFVVDESTPACERVAAARAFGVSLPRVQRLAQGSGARGFVRQRAAVDAAVPSGRPRHGEGVPDARGRQGCAQVPTAVDRAEGLELLIKSWPFPRFVHASTRAYVVVLGELRRGCGYRGGGLKRPCRS